MALTTLSNLTNASRPKKARRRVGRGPSSQLGKTCGRGQKGQGARSGYKRRYGFEGGQCPLFKKLPTRGFSNARFRKAIYSINLSRIEELFEDGEVVNAMTLRLRGMISGRCEGIKILGEGTLTKKVKIQADLYSASAKSKLDEAGASYEVCSIKDLLTAE